MQIKTKIRTFLELMVLNSAHFRIKLCGKNLVYFGLMRPNQHPNSSEVRLQRDKKALQIQLSRAGLYQTMVTLNTLLKSGKWQRT